jgi:hypothetical protein
VNYKTVILPEAKIEFKEAIAYYKNINPKLSGRFYGSVTESLNSIKSEPLRCQLRYDNVRIKMLKTFPYLIHYSVMNLKL